jgi:hypothetical protein
MIDEQFVGIFPQNKIVLDLGVVVFKLKLGHFVPSHPMVNFIRERRGSYDESHK